MVFRKSAFNKVIETIKQKQISYAVFEKEEGIEKYNYQKLNKYKIVLKEAMKNVDIILKINDIMCLLKKIEYDKLCILLDKIGEWCIDEK